MTVEWKCQDKQICSAWIKEIKTTKCIYCILFS